MSTVDHTDRDSGEGRGTEMMTTRSKKRDNYWILLQIWMRIIVYNQYMHCLAVLNHIIIIIGVSSGMNVTSSILSADPPSACRYTPSSRRR